MKKGIARDLPCILVDDTDFKTRETGVAYTAVTVEYAKEGDSSFTEKTLASEDWDEIGNGIYNISFTAAELDTKGKFIFNVKGTGYLDYSGKEWLTDSDFDLHESAQATHRQYMSGQAGKDVAITIEQFESLSDLEIFRGDKKLISFALKNNGQALDLTGATVMLAAKENYADTQLFFDKQCTITDPTGGLCEVLLTATETAQIKELMAELEITWADSSKSTYGDFNIRIKPDLRTGA